MEQELIAGGVPVAEVQRLCEVHVGAFRGALDAREEVDAPPGHPVHTYMAENRRIETLARTMTQLAGEPERRSELAGLVEELGGIDNHYVRKENQLFPLLERHGLDVVPKVMWGVHDEIRVAWKELGAAVSEQRWDEVEGRAPEVARTLDEMVYKEERILFPLCMQTLSEQDWREVREGEDELGYAFAVPGTDWPDRGGSSRLQVLGAAPTPRPAHEGLLPMQTGVLSLEQVNLLLTHLPLDLSFVDENDIVRFYSEGERHFPRTPAVIGRRVQNCHPPHSVHMVQAILDAFRAGERDRAEFWLNFQGAFLHISYIAVRDADGTYRGCLETGQEVSRIRALEGERRLLEWD